MTAERKIWTAAIGAAAVIYILLRFWHLTDSCLWFDEIFGINAAEKPWGEMFRFIALDLIHPPLFYVLLKIWINIGGESLFWLRLFPFVFSILALPVFYLFGKQIKMSYPAIIAALSFFAANGALIKYAQEVRMYSLLLFFAALSMWLFARFLNLGKDIKILTIINILLVYTHYFGWFVVGAEVSVILLLQRIKIRQILTMSAICLAAFAPWVFAVSRASRVNTDLAQNIGWMSRPNPASLVQFVFDLIEPFYFQMSGQESASRYFITIPLLLIVVAAAGFFLFRYSKQEDFRRQNLIMLAVFVALPVLLALAASLVTPYSIWGTRHLIIVFPPALLLVGIFFDEIEIQNLKIGLFAAALLLFVAAFILESRRPPQTFIWCAWENLAENIDKNQPAKIYVFEDLVAYHFWFAERNNPNAQIIKIENLAGMTEDKAYFLPRGFNDVERVNFDDIADDKFYVAFRDTEWNPQKPPLKNLIAKGCRIGAPKIFEAQGLKAFLVQVER